jgi:RTX calcium-binding nonapeptide repeat (4 copies)
VSKRQRRTREQRRRRHARGTSRRQLATGAGLALGATLGITGTAHAADFTVSNLGDSGAGSLRQAVTDSNNNPGPDRVLFQSGLSGTITLNTGELYIDDAVQIVGPGPGQLSVVSPTDRVAAISPGDGQSVSVSGLTLSGHVGNSGGVFFTGNIGSANNLTISDSVLTGSTSTNNGGAIYVYAGSLQVENTTINGNTADNAGGGIYFGATSAPSAIRNSTISGNTVTDQGGNFDDAGAVYLDNDKPMSPILIQNSTLVGNSAPDRGGAIYDFSYQAPGGPSALTIESSTIAGNTAGNVGGGIYHYYTETIRNTILADNTSADGSDISSDEQPADVAFSLIERAGTPFSSTGPNITGVDPQLGPLASNGGPTQTEALPPTSPAIDKGFSSLPGDQRGSGRPADLTTVPNAAGGNGADIGAFELPPTCRGRTATVFSTGSQKIAGTKRADVIVGTAGKDKIKAKAGNDLVCALGGKDTVKGGKGKDKLLGGPGRDKLIGGPGKDKLKGGPGKDVQKQ